MSTTNSICIFLGGAAVGSFATVAVMKKMGYHKDGEILEAPQESTDEVDPELQELGDKPSFVQKKELDTHRTRYDTIRTKPSPEELIQQYAEAEHPREDDDGEEDEDSDFPTEDLGGKVITDEYVKNLPDADEEYDEETALQMEIAESLMAGPIGDEYEETEGFGHVICELRSLRRDTLIYLIPEAYYGEVYPTETLTYYERDNVLCDSTDIPVDNVPQLVGDALEHFGECDGEPETNEDQVYVRNCSLGFEYEIVRVDASFGAHLYGVSDEDFEGGAMANIPRKATKRKNTQQEED